MLSSCNFRVARLQNKVATKYLIRVTSLVKNAPNFSPKLLSLSLLGLKNPAKFPPNFSQNFPPKSQKKVFTDELLQERRENASGTIAGLTRVLRQEHVANANTVPSVKSHPSILGGTVAPCRAGKHPGTKERQSPPPKQEICVLRGACPMWGFRENRMGVFGKGGSCNSRLFVLKPDAAIASEVSISRENPLK